MSEPHPVRSPELELAIEATRAVGILSKHMYDLSETLKTGSSDVRGAYNACKVFRSALEVYKQSKFHSSMKSSAARRTAQAI